MWQFGVVTPVSVEVYLPAVFLAQQQPTFATGRTVNHKVNVTYYTMVVYFDKITNTNSVILLSRYKVALVKLYIQVLYYGKIHGTDSLCTFYVAVHLPSHVFFWTGWFTMALIYLFQVPSPMLNFIFHGKK